ncbi:hypothetical protein KSP40_PGU001822 [Platanthera guangdongensis]|uniref:DUF4219 domain-containing protein n=1 Tax=Platanthera guangdongensis TaxID=2320717 RepID=A0ABR2MTV5_9ASPA
MVHHDHAFHEGQGISIPLLFTGTDYNYWKIRTCFLIALDNYVWAMVDQCYAPPTFVVGEIIMEKLKDK